MPRTITKKNRLGSRPCDGLLFLLPELVSGERTAMGRKKKESNIKSVMYSYVGTDDQFDHFLKMMIHDYLSVDDPYTNQPADSVGKVENEVA